MLHKVSEKVPKVLCRTFRKNRSQFLLPNVIIKCFPKEIRIFNIVFSKLI